METIIQLSRASRLHLKLPNPVLQIGPTASWFAVSGRPRVSLETRHPLRRILQGLAVRSPEAISPQDMVALGWPDERIQPRAAMSRVYSAVHALRNLGLQTILTRRNYGWVLDAVVRVVVEESSRLKSIHARCEAPAARIDFHPACLP